MVCSSSSGIRVVSVTQPMGDDPSDPSSFLAESIHAALAESDADIADGRTVSFEEIRRHLDDQAR
jgi:hypothetical protein